jgi:acyl-CoA synthetase (AMP-forming)/AMP-acid ligase II
MFHREVIVRFIEEPGLTANIQTTYSNLVELACSRANEKPDQTAYVFLQDGENESGRLTFADLDRRARAIAARLQSMGMTGERALLLYPPGLNYIEGFFGCLYAGVVAVPASPPTRRQQSRLLAVINDAAPTVIMTTADLAAKYRHEFACGSDASVAIKKPQIATRASLPRYRDRYGLPRINREPNLPKAGLNPYLARTALLFSNTPPVLPETPKA